MAKVLLKSQLRKLENTDKRRVAILGYTGAAVDLRDMGIPDPLVYNMEGFRVDNNIPYYEEHRTLIGHTIENSKQDGQLMTIAEHSVENERSLAVYNALSSGEHYEASMGVEVNMDDVIFIESGTVQVNNKTFQAPIYVANSGVVTEMTATKSGRDGNTSVHLLSTEYEEGKDLLMKIKNARLAVRNSTPAPVSPPETPTPDPVPTPAPVLTIPNAPPAPPVPVEPPAPLPISNPVDWMFDYVDHPIGRTLLRNARAQGWTEDQMKREIEIAQIQNSYPRVPNVYRGDNEDAYLARMAYGYGVSLQTIKNNLGEKAADIADKQGPMSLRESLMLCANANGGSFNGHSDAVTMSKHIKRLVVNNAFSTIDYPNLMNRVADWKLSEAWLIDPPQAPGYCKTVNNKDFRVQTHIKAGGGKMWESLDKDGKISHGVHGTEDKYNTQLNTIAQIVTFKREDIINDDIGWIEETLNIMLDGALMVPDYLFVNLFYGANAAGVVTASQSYFTLALDEANLTTVYNAVRRRFTAKVAPGNDKTVNGRFNTRWNLVVPPALEAAAWSIIKSERIVQNDVKGALGNVGEANYWFNRLDISVMDNLDNTTYNSGAKSTAWGLFPARETYRPFYIAYLGQRNRPVTETVDLPADELGFGVRGYWDVNLGYRPMEGNKLQACAISVPA
jgi:hypothetical protein